MNILTALKHELKLASVSLLRVPGFALTVITTLAITLGALICIFNLNHLLLVKSLPYPDAERLLVVHQVYTENGESYSGAQSVPGMVLWYQQQQVFSEFALIRNTNALITEHPNQPEVEINFVTPEYFSLLQPKMQLGRVFTASEGLDMHQPVTVLTYDSWQQWYHGDTNIIGKSTTLGDISFKIIGVTAPDFKVPDNRNHEKIDLFLPWDYQDLDPLKWGVMTRALTGLGKLKTPVSLVQATASLSAILNEAYLASGAGEAGDTAGVKLLSLKDAIIGNSQKTALLLLSGILALLLIAITNVTNLFLSRAAEKQRTMAIQAALGAKPAHLFTAMFAESLILCTIAGLLGLLVAGWGFVLVQALAAKQLPLMSELGLDSITLAFTVLVVMALAIIFAKLASRVVKYGQLQAQLQSSGKGSGLQISAKTRNGLIITQVILATLLLVGATAVIQQALKTVFHPLGFNEQEVIYLSIDKPKDVDLVARNLLTLAIVSQLEKLPAVAQVARNIAPTIFQGKFSMGINDSNDQRIGSFFANMVDHNYFELLELPIIAGRTFTPQKDPEYNIDEIILSESLAKHLAPNGDALGNSYQLQAGSPLKVIGIVQDYYIPGQSSDDFYQRYYLPYAAFRDLGFDIKLTPGATLDRQSVLAILTRIDPKLRIRTFINYSQSHQQLIYRHKLTAWLTIVLAGLALLLSAGGIYGVLNYSTQMRRYELGIHMALGAKTQRIRNMVLKQGLRPVVTGLLISIAVTVLLFIVARQQLTQVLTLDWRVLLYALPVMLLVSYFACYLPVKKVIMADPVKALRNE